MQLLMHSAPFGMPPEVGVFYNQAQLEFGLRPVFVEFYLTQAGIRLIPR
jgi:hypothetical protein